ncbi:unnamed protein product [Linum tenue]|uniref:Uncharacterized protein n=1 Tax=Linum tenue TaxID=586396 RepID=A0AAV0QR07_9ROSI|nr:unnamed protein product [Linum tenue]
MNVYCLRFVPEDWRGMLETICSLVQQQGTVNSSIVGGLWSWYIALLWRERSCRVFNSSSKSIEELNQQLQEEIHCCSLENKKL